MPRLSPQRARWGRNNSSHVAGTNSGRCFVSIPVSGPLRAQFVLLLVLFVKPLLVQQGGTQSGGAFYRRVVIRNLVCTALVCTSYLITTVVMVLALLKETPDDNTVSEHTSELGSLTAIGASEIVSHADRLCSREGWEIPRFIQSKNSYFFAAPLTCSSQTETQTPRPRLATFQHSKGNVAHDSATS